MMLNTLFIIILLIPSQWGREDNRGAWGLSRWGYEFNPAQYNPVWWDDATYALASDSAACDSGEAVQYLTNRTGNNTIYRKQTTGADQSQYRSNVVNGLPALHFDGNDYFPMTGNMSAIVPAAFEKGFAWSCVFAFDDGIPTATQVVFEAQNTTGGNDFYFYLGVTNDGSLRSSLVGADGIAAELTLSKICTNGVTQFYCVTCIADSTDSLRTWVNGEAVAAADLTALNWDGIDSTPDDVEKVALGCLVRDGVEFASYHLVGYAAEWVVYSESMMQAMALRVDDWMRDKYNIRDFEYALGTNVDISQNTYHEMGCHFTKSGGTQDSLAYLIYKRGEQHAFPDTSAIMLRSYNINTETWGTPDTLDFDNLDERPNAFLVIQDTIRFFVKREKCDASAIALVQYNSFDGGVNWSEADTIIASAHDEISYIPFNQFVETNTPGEYVNISQSVTIDAGQLGIVLMKTTDGGVTYTYSDVFVDNTEFSEASIVHLGSGRMIGWLRGNAVGAYEDGCWQTTSSNNGVTWSTPEEVYADGIALCNQTAIAPFMTYDSEFDRLICSLNDRTSRLQMVCIGEPDECFDDPTAYYATKQLQAFDYTGYWTFIEISPGVYLGAGSQSINYESSDADIYTNIITFH